MSHVTSQVPDKAVNFETILEDEAESESSDFLNKSIHKSTNESIDVSSGKASRISTHNSSDKLSKDHDEIEEVDLFTVQSMIEIILANKISTSSPIIDSRVSSGYITVPTLYYLYPEERMFLYLRGKDQFYRLFHHKSIIYMILTQSAYYSQSKQDLYQQYVPQRSIQSSNAAIPSTNASDLNPVKRNSIAEVNIYQAKDLANLNQHIGTSAVINASTQDDKSKPKKRSSFTFLSSRSSISTSISSSQLSDMSKTDQIAIPVKANQKVDIFEWVLVISNIYVSNLFYIDSHGKPSVWLEFGLPVSAAVIRQSSSLSNDEVVFTTASNSQSATDMNTSYHEKDMLNVLETTVKHDDLNPDWRNDKVTVNDKNSSASSSIPYTVEIVLLSSSMIANSNDTSMNSQSVDNALQKERLLLTQILSNTLSCKLKCKDVTSNFFSYSSSQGM